jgi:hypothetical protein
MDSRTPAQRAASRENGRRGRGPTTEDGKRRSAQNSTKHGLTGGQITVQGEDPDAWDDFLADYVDLYQPVGASEYDCVSSIAASSWRLRRASAVEASAIRQAIARRRERDDDAGPPGAEGDERIEPDDLGDVFIEVDAHGVLTKNLPRYASRLSRLRKAEIAMLEDLQRRRRRRDQQRAGRNASCAEPALDDQRGDVERFESEKLQNEPESGGGLHY